MVLILTRVHVPQAAGNVYTGSVNGTSFSHEPASVGLQLGQDEPASGGLESGKDDLGSVATKGGVDASGGVGEPDPEVMDPQDPQVVDPREGGNAAMQD